MPRRNLLPPYRGYVRANFEDGPHSFTLPKGTTLEELSGHLEELVRPYHGQLLDLIIKFETVPHTHGIERLHRDKTRKWPVHFQMAERQSDNTRNIGNV